MWSRIWTLFDKKLVTSSFLKLGKPCKQGPAKELAKHFVHGVQVESGMVSHKCLKGNLMNASMTTNLRVGGCDLL